MVIFLRASLTVYSLVS